MSHRDPRTQTHAPPTYAHYLPPPLRRLKEYEQQLSLEHERSSVLSKTLNAKEIELAEMRELEEKAAKLWKLESDKRSKEVR